MKRKNLYYLLITLASIVMVLTAYFGGWFEPLIARKIKLRLGNAALILLWIVLFAKPLMMILCNFSGVKVLKWKNIVNYIKSSKHISASKIKNILFTVVRVASCLVMKYRRLLGITVFILAFSHGGVYAVARLKTGFGIASQREQFRILAGYISLFSLFIGYITSNDLSIKIFKNSRIWIQRSAYLALIFVVLHLMFLNPGEYWSHLVLLGIYLYLKGVEKDKCRFILKPPIPTN